MILIQCLHGGFYLVTWYRRLGAYIRLKFKNYLNAFTGSLLFCSSVSLKLKSDAESEVDFNL